MSFPVNGAVSISIAPLLDLVSYYVTKAVYFLSMLGLSTSGFAFTIPMPLVAALAHTDFYSNSKCV